MKRSVVCSLGVALSLLLAASASTAVEASDSSMQNVKVGVLFLGESNTPYYGQLDPDSNEVSGYYADVFREIDKADASLSFEIIPITVEDPYAPVEIDESGCDLITGWVDQVDPSQIEYDYLNHTLMFNREVYVTNDPDTPQSLTLADLVGRKIAYYENDENSWYLTNNMGNEFEMIELSLWDIGPASMLEAVSNGEYDALIPAYYLNKSYMPDSLGFAAISGTEFVEGSYMMNSMLDLAYRKDKKELADHFTETLHTMMKEGALTELARSYFGVDVSQPTDDPEQVENLWHNYEMMTSLF